MNNALFTFGLIMATQSDPFKVDEISMLSADEALSEYGQKYDIFLQVGNWKVSTTINSLYYADKICGKPENMVATVNHSKKTITLKDKA